MHPAYECMCNRIAPRHVGRHSATDEISNPVVVLTEDQLLRLLEQAAKQGKWAGDKFWSDDAESIAKDVIEDEGVKFS